MRVILTARFRSRLQLSLGMYLHVFLCPTRLCRLHIASGSILHTYYMLVSSTVLYGTLHQMSNDLPGPPPPPTASPWESDSSVSAPKAASHPSIPPAVVFSNWLPSSRRNCQSPSRSHPVSL